MTQTSPPGERLTSRERRIQEQRRKIDAHRQQQRARRLVWVAVAVVIAVVLLVLGLFLYRPPVQAQGHQVPIEGNRQHMPQGTQIDYRNRPPSSGDHYDNPAGYAFYPPNRPVPTGNWVHNLEHGATAVLYRPDLCDATCQGQLQDIYNSAPASSLFPGIKKLVITPYTDMDHMIATVAWGWLDEMDQIDKDRILAFYKAHLDKGPELAQ